MRRIGLITYLASAIAVIAALAWVTRHALDLERQARLQEAIRLALWRMDASLGPLLVRESARPYFHYQAFFPAERAYTRMLQPVRPGEVLVASPILLEPNSLVRLHFQRVPAFATPDPTVTSPEVPPAELKALAGTDVPAPERLARSEQHLGQLADLLATPDLDRKLTAAANLPISQLSTRASEVQDRGAGQVLFQQQEQSQTAQSLNEYQARQEWNLQGQRAANFTNNRVNDDAATATKSDQPAGLIELQDKAKDDKALSTGLAWSEPAPPIQQGDFAAVWLTRPVAAAPWPSSELVFLRMVHLGDQRVLQGFWVDWPALRQSLLTSIQDLLPQASIVPLDTTPYPGTANLAQALASIPAALIVPPDATPLPNLSAGWTPTRTALLVTWVAVLGALGAVALVLRAAGQLAERRGRFVSAVTHELRTPLTTFCLYSQMLSDDMVREESARRDYLRTLKTESTRLAGLVENVLSYARLSRPRQQHVNHPADLRNCRKLVEQIAPVLRDRAAQSGVELIVEDNAPAGAGVCVEARTIERILYNLVDNAGKYAAGDSSADKRLHITATVAMNTWNIAVRDHGPGIPRSEQRRIFDAFARGRAHADSPAQGLGLGLALARGLARELGGDLRLSPTDSGACFVLELPVRWR